MSKEKFTNGKTADCIELGLKDMDNGKLEGVGNHLLSDYTPEKDSTPTKKSPQASPSSSHSGSAPSPDNPFDEIVYDDEDWLSEDEDDDRPILALDHSMEEGNCMSRTVSWIQFSVAKFDKWVNTWTKGYFWKTLFLVAYLCYFIIAMNYSFGDESSWRLLVCTIIGVLILSRGLISSGLHFLFRSINGSDHLRPHHLKIWKRVKFVFQWTMNIALLALMIYVMVDEGLRDLNNLRSLPGLFIFLFVCLLFSNNPAKIDWYVIYWSMGMQFLLATVALKGKWGREAVWWMQERLNEFFKNSHEGSVLVFGDEYKEHYMIFAALPMIFLTNATLVLLYYLGAMQLFIEFIGKCINFVLHTSPMECISVAGGIFLEGGVMALSLRPFLGTFSKSELFVLITSGLASLGGTYVAILAAYGVTLEFIIPAMLVSAPATFTVCKLMVPESLERKRKTKGRDQDWDMGNMEKERYSSGLEALQGGAVALLGLLGNIVAVAFVFMSYISWVNHTLEWFGNRVGIEQLSIELIFSYILFPVSMAMGVEFDDCRRVGMLLGYRIGSTNIIAFLKLNALKDNKKEYMKYMEATNFTGPVSYRRDHITLDLWNKTLEHGFLSQRSEAIITYCLVGFSSAVSIGIFLSFLYVLVPRRRQWMTKMAFPALVAGNVANCMTGCFAGIFY